MCLIEPHGPLLGPLGSSNHVPERISRDQPVTTPSNNHPMFILVHEG